MVAQIALEHSARVRVFWIVNINVVQQCFRVISYASREINGTLGRSAHNIVYVFLKAVIAINLH